NAHPLPSTPVETHQTPVLHGRVYGIRVLGIHARVEAIAPMRDEAIAVSNAARIPGPRGTAKAEIVLRAAIYVIEWHCVIHCDVIELRDRQVGLEYPVLSLVEAFINAAVTAHHVTAIVLGIDPDLVIVDMLVA